MNGVSRSGYVTLLFVVFSFLSFIERRWFVYAMGMLEDFKVLTSFREGHVVLFEQNYKYFETTKVHARIDRNGHKFVN